MNDSVSVSNNFLDQVQRRKRLKLGLGTSVTGQQGGGGEPRQGERRAGGGHRAERVPAGAELPDPSAGFTVRWDQPGTAVRAPGARRVSPASGLFRCR